MATRILVVLASAGLIGCSQSATRHQARSQPRADAASGLSYDAAAADFGSVLTRDPRALTPEQRRSLCGVANFDDGYFEDARVTLYYSGEYKKDAPPGGCGLSAGVEFTGRWHVDGENIVLIDQWGEEEGRIPVASRMAPRRLTLEGAGVAAR